MPANPSPSLAELLDRGAPRSPDRDTLEAWGRAVGAALPRPAVITLAGDLGAGKSTLCRMIIQALNPAITDIPSPTFTLVQQYDTPKGELWHCDLYRLKHPDEIQELGLEDAFHEVITLIEWPEKMGHYLPADRVDIQLTINMTSRISRGTDPLREMTILCEGDVNMDFSGL